MKLLGVGLPRAGSTTVAAALSMSGLSVAHNRVYDFHFSRRPDRVKYFANPQIKPKHMRCIIGREMQKSFKRGRDPLERYAYLDAIIHPVWRHCWVPLDYGMLLDIRRRHKNLIFLYHYRDVSRHAQSLLWSRTIEKFAPHGIFPFDATQAQVEDIIVRHREELFKQFGDDPNFKTINIEDEDAPRQLSKIVGRAIPWWGKISIGGTR